MTVVNIAKGIDVITEGYIPLNSQSIRETVNSIITSDQLYVSNRKKLRTERQHNKRPSFKRAIAAFCSI